MIFDKCFDKCYKKKNRDKQCMSRSDCSLVQFDQNLHCLVLEIMLVNQDVI